MAYQTEDWANLLDFKNIYVGYDEGPVLEGVNLTIEAGQHWAILGANGSGKSTLIKLISNDMYPNPRYPFKKELFGKERWNIFELKQNLGIITHDLHNYFAMHGKFLTAYEVVLSGYFSSIGVFKHQDFTADQHQKALEILVFLDIAAIKDKRVDQMSTGQLRLCVIGRALIHNPQALLLDEPTIGLDFKAQHRFLKLLRKLSHQVSIILVTHHIEEVFEEISHVALMHNKMVYKQGLKTKILNSENLSTIFDIQMDLQHKNGRYYIESIDDSL